MINRPTTMVSKRLFDLISNRLPEQDTYPYEVFSSSFIPNQTQLFLKAEIEFSARTLLFSLKSNRFDFQSPKLHTARYTFASELVKTTELRKDDFIKLLETALSLNFQYLIRPQKVLKELLFGDRFEKPIADIEERIQNFCEYRYLINVFLQYIERKKPTSLSIDKFERIISEIDTKLCTAFAPNDLMMLFQPIFLFYEHAQLQSVEISVLIEFLSEKKYTDPLERLTIAQQNGISSITAQALNELLFANTKDLTNANLPTKDLPQTVVNDFQTPSIHTGKSHATETHGLAANVQSSELSDSNAETKQPSQEITQHRVQLDSKPPVLSTLETTIVTPIEIKQFVPASENDQNDLKSKFEQTDFLSEKVKQSTYDTPKEIVQPGNLQDIRLMISTDERKKYIKKLFKGSEEEYNFAISAINEKATWREASLFIDREVLSRFKVDEFSNEAVSFIDLVFERYQTR